MKVNYVNNCKLLTLYWNYVTNSFYFSVSRWSEAS